jgi:hypothetical protein
MVGDDGSDDAADRVTTFPHGHFVPALATLIDSTSHRGETSKSVFAVGGFTPIGHQVVTEVTALIA